MRAIMADNDIQGQINRLVLLLNSEAWRDIWISLNLDVWTFADLSLDASISDADLWQSCQREKVVLITGNRNKVGPDSLEATIQAFNAAASLPVMTLARPKHILHNRAYAERVVEALLLVLLDIDNYRGAGRLWLP